MSYPLLNIYVFFNGYSENVRRKLTTASPFAISNSLLLGTSDLSNRDLCNSFLSVSLMMPWRRRVCVFLQCLITVSIPLLPVTLILLSFIIFFLLVLLLVILITFCSFFMYFHHCSLLIFSPSYYLSLLLLLSLFSLTQSFCSFSDILPPLLNSYFL